MRQTGHRSAEVDVAPQRTLFEENPAAFTGLQQAWSTRRDSAMATSQ